VERFGKDVWFDRLIEVTDAILDAGDVQTRLGVIIAPSTELNGAQLQVLSRLYWATRDERYLEMAERIAELYLFDVIPANGGLPSDYWDFSAQHPLSEDTRFRPQEESIAGVYPFGLMDHGGEIISGLSELYYLERMLGRPQADRYRQPLQDFLDRVLVTGRREDGMWCRSVDTVTLKPFNADPVDTWGYNLAGIWTFDLADGTRRHAGDIEQMMRTVAAQKSIDWEWGPEQDGYADTIESMLYLLPWFDIPEAHYWVDDEIEVMFLKQREDGFVEGWYLDGNFARTTMLYALYKTQGLRLTPWSESVRVGASLDRQNDVLYVHLAAQEPWSGKLQFDVPRHRTIWGMPAAYPRVNGAPEWYVVEPEAVYSVTDLDTGEVASVSGQDLADGLPVSVGVSRHNVLRLAVSRQQMP